jgi:hypothetical protein
LAAIFVNPYGPRIILPTVETLFYFHQVPGLVQEWKPLGMEELPVFWASLAALLGLWLWRMRVGDKKALFWTPVIFFFSAWGMTSYRSSAIFAFPAVAFAADMLQDVSFSEIGRLILGTVLLAIQAPVLAAPLPPGPVWPHHTPEGACGFVRAQGIEGRLYNPYGLGGYIEWALGPDRKVFMDGRGDLFLPFLIEEDAMFRAFPASERSQAWRAYLGRYGIDHAILDYEDGRAVRLPGRDEVYVASFAEKMFPAKDWALVYWDDASLVVLKRIPRFAELIRRYEYRTLWPQQQERMTALLQDGQVDRRTLGQELARHERETGFTIRGDVLKRLSEKGSS